MLRLVLLSLLITAGSGMAEARGTRVARAKAAMPVSTAPQLGQDDLASSLILRDTPRDADARFLPPSLDGYPGQEEGLEVRFNGRGIKMKMPVDLR